MNDRRRTWVRCWLIRLGHAVLADLTTLGSYWCAGYLSATARPSRLDVHGDAETHGEAMRGIAEIEAYLEALDHPTRRPSNRRQPRGRDLT